MEWLIYLTFLLVGFYLGHKTNKTNAVDTNVPKEIKVPNLNPIKAYKEHKEKTETDKEMEREIKKYETILANIENYDGTGANQQDVPM